MPTNWGIGISISLSHIHLLQIYFIKLIINMQSKPNNKNWIELDLFHFLFDEF